MKDVNGIETDPLAIGKSIEMKDVIEIAHNKVQISENNLESSGSIAQNNR